MFLFEPQILRSAVSGFVFLVTPEDYLAFKKIHEFDKEADTFFHYHGPLIKTICQIEIRNYCVLSLVQTNDCRRNFVLGKHF